MIERNHMENPDEITWKIQMIAQKGITLKNPDDHTEINHMENRDDRTERNMESPVWLWYITPIANRKMAFVHHAHRKKKNGEKKNGRGISPLLRKEEWQHLQVGGESNR